MKRPGPGIGPLAAAACATSLALAIPSTTRAEETITSLPPAGTPAPAPQSETRMNSPGMVVSGSVLLGLGTVGIVTAGVSFAEGGWGGILWGSLGTIVGGPLVLVGLPLTIAGAVQVPVGPPVPKYVGPTRTNSPEMMIAGGVLLGTGAVTLTASAIGLSLANDTLANSCSIDPVDAACNARYADAEVQSGVATGFLIGGIAMIGVGIPLLAVGAKQVPDETRGARAATSGVTAEVSVGPTGILVHGSF
ncbi:MAG: hypothetical protein U0414_27440 [Polyangiaceae bacterium]